MRLGIAIMVGLAVMGGCRRNKGAAVAPTGSIEERIDAQARSEEPLAELVGELHRGAAAEEDDGGSWQVPLQGGECYWFSAAGEAGVDEVLIELFEPEDDDRVESEKESPGAVMKYCPKESGSFRLALRVTEGRGPYAVGVFKKGTGQPGAAGGPTDLASTADARAAVVAPDAERKVPHHAGKAPQGDWYFELVPGTCYWFVGVASEGVANVSLELWSPKEERVAFLEAEAPPIVIEHCAAVGGMFHLQAKGVGEGELLVGQYEKPATMAAWDP